MTAARLTSMPTGRGVLADIVEDTRESVIVVDADGPILHVNAAFERASGFRADEVVGRHVATIHADPDDGPWPKLVARLVPGEAWTGEILSTRRDGTKYVVETSVTPVLDGGGQIAAYVAVQRDPTAQRALEARARLGSRMEALGQLASGIVHDFNNMLFVINGQATVLDHDLDPVRRGSLDLDETLRKIRAIREAGGRAGALTAQLLAFSRQEVINPQVLDLNAAIEGLEPMVRTLIGGNLRLVLRLGRGTGHIRADASQLDEVLINLVVNARDAMPDGGRVTIETGNVLVDEPHAAEFLDLRAGPYVLLAVSDTGVGMDHATQERIFEPLFTTKEPGKGTGLGLATAHGIVHQAGGHIWVYSEPGVGSTFKIYFPRVERVESIERPETPAVGTKRRRRAAVRVPGRDPEPGAREGSDRDLRAETRDVGAARSRRPTGAGHAPADPCSGVQQPTGASELVISGAAETSPPILIVDDDEATRELLRRHLGGEGFEVREADCGEAALGLIESEAVSQVILDMRMPGLSGTDVIRAIRARPRMETLPIMVLTGQGDAYPPAASLGVGADDYLTKPIRLDELVARVRARMRSQRVAAERARRDSEVLYRALVEHSADGILVSDRTGRYVEANRAICEMLGYSRDELLAMFTPSLSAVDDPLTPHEMDERLADAAEGAGLLVERRYRRSDGSSLPVEVGFSQLPDGRLQRNIRDISARLAAEAERTELVAAVEQTADAVWIKDASGSTVRYVNRSFSTLYGYAPDEIVGHYAGILHSGRHERAFFDAIWAAVAAGKTWSGSIVNRHRDGGLVEVEAVISGIRDPSGRLVSYMQTDRDVTRERALERAQEREVRERETISAALARIDPAASGEAIAAAACAVIIGLPGVDSTIAVALDDVGGTALAVVGKLASAVVPGVPVAEDRVAFLRERGSAGPWFEEWRPDQDAGTWAEAITATGLVTTAYAPLRGPHGLIGVVGIGSHDPATAPSLVEHMSALTSFASTLGALLAPRLEDRRRDLEGRAAIQAVLDASAFAPFFQPIVDLRTNSVVGYEALTRFADGVSPDVKFITADRVGLGMELEVATMRAALEAATILPPDAYLSLNASPALIDSGQLQGLLRGRTRAIVLEITEHVAIDDYPALRASLAALGPTVRLAVDDAGAGYASLRHILELAPDFVKLDIGLIRGIDMDPARQALLAGMGYFAVKRKIRLVAEGIETATELESLRGLAIRYGQGYLLARPRDGRDPAPWPSTVDLGRR